MSDFNVGDEIEIVSNPGYFWDRIKPGMKGRVTTVNANGGLYIEVDVDDVGPCSQSVSRHKLGLIQKVKKEIKKSGFAKFIRGIENVDNMQ